MQFRTPGRERVQIALVVMGLQFIGLTVGWVGSMATLYCGSTAPFGPVTCEGNLGLAALWLLVGLLFAGLVLFLVMGVWERQPRSMAAVVAIELARIVVALVDNRVALGPIGIGAVLVIVMLTPIPRPSRSG